MRWAPRAGWGPRRGWVAAPSLRGVPSAPRHLSWAQPHGISADLASAGARAWRPVESPSEKAPPEVFGPQDLPPSPKVAPVLWTQGPKRASREQLRALPSPRAERVLLPPHTVPAVCSPTQVTHLLLALGWGWGWGGRHVLRERVFLLDSPEKSLWPGTATQTESSGSWGLSSGVSPGR